MFRIEINEGAVFFSKFFREEDGEKVLAAIAEEGYVKRVIFIDTAATPDLLRVITALKERGLKVVVRDHHRGEGHTPEVAEEIERLLGNDALIVTRKEAPGCAQLVEEGEFQFYGDVVVADPDLDGLTAAMKAAGAVYDGLDKDAEVLDVRPLQSAETLTELGWTACRALGTLPPYNPKAPERALAAKARLFCDIVATVQGCTQSREELRERVEAYEGQVAEAQRLLAEEMSKPCNGVVLVDSEGAERFDLNTLTRGMASDGAVVTVVRKDFGPIAGQPGGHGVQYSLAVAYDHQRDLDLCDLVPKDAERSLQAGLLSNNSFLLHCSEDVWEGTILPALNGRLG